MDREITTKSFKPQRFLYWIAGIAIFFCATYYARTIFSKKLDNSDIVLAKVRRGDLEDTVMATGKVRPNREVVITSPLGTTIKALKKNNGDKVRKGDEIILLEQAVAKLEYNRLQDELALKENNVKRLKLRLEKDIRDIEIDDKIEELQIKNLATQLKDLKHLQTIGGATLEEVEQAENQLRMVQLKKKKLENNLGYQKAVIDAEVENESLQSSIQRKLMQELENKINQAQVLSPIDGVVTWVNPSIGVKVQEGEPISRVADLSQYYIEATASDMHAKKIKEGQMVNVKINNDFLKGYIEQIIPTMDNGVMKFKVVLENPNSNLLRPNMQVNISIVLSKKSNTLYIANGQAYKGGKIQKFFVRNGDVLEQKELSIGVTNSRSIEILSGIKEGDEIVISDMDRYKDVPSITYKTTE